jgi:hypothetical protein
MGVKNTIKCEICGCQISPNTGCLICGWDGKTKYVTPFEDKENFDQQLFDSIQLPKKPRSAKRWFIFLTIPVLLFAILIGPAGLILEGLPLLVYAIMRSNEKEWKWKVDNFEQYRILMYNLSKPDKDQEQVMQENVRRFNSAPIRYAYIPSKYNPPVARYFAYPGTQKKVEIILGENEYIEIPFSEIIGVQVLEDAEVRGGIGRAIVGGVIAGEAGAIVGATTRSKTVTSFVVRINSNNLQHPAYDIPLINSNTSVDSKEYKLAVTFANDVQASIKSIVFNQTPENAPKQMINKASSSNSRVGVAEEIKKFKELMDDGIITKEEFEAKKKQLLDL